MKNKTNKTKEIFNQIKQILGGSKLLAVLFVILIISLAIGTFIDADIVSPPSKYTNKIIYKSKWLELVLALFALNFIFNIYKFQLINRKKWGTLILHLSFIIILLGGGVTRYKGVEGVVHVEENESVNSFYSNEGYLHVFIDGFEKGNASRKILHPISLDDDDDVKNKLLNFSFGLDNYSCKILEIRDNAEIREYIKPTIKEHGSDFLRVVENTNGNRRDHFLSMSKSIVIDRSIISFSSGKDEIPSTISLIKKDELLLITSKRGGLVQNMINNQVDSIVADSTYNLQLMSAYHFGDLSFVIPQNIIHGILQDSLITSTKSSKIGVSIEVVGNNERKVINVTGEFGERTNFKRLDVGDVFLNIGYGSKEYFLPFSFKLIDFTSIRYPGENKVYKSFSSIVEIEGNKLSKVVSVNEPLDVEEYRIFQASFDEDERGVYFIVNHDWWGRTLSYFGYFLLFLSCVFILFGKKSRFFYLRKQLTKIRSNSFIVLLVVGFSFCNKVMSNSPSNVNDIVKPNISKELSNAFGELIVQDENGRMKPINTFGSELLRRISEKDYYKSFNANQFIFSVIQEPQKWLDVDIIKLKRGNDSLRNILGVNLKQKYVSLNDFFTSDKQLKLPPKLIEIASKGLNPSKFEKDILRAFENQYLFSKLINRGVLKIFPIPNDSLNRWVSFDELREVRPEYFVGEFERLCQEVFKNSSSIPHVIEKFLSQLGSLQKKYGKAVIPSKSKVRFEILYNRIYIFQKISTFNFFIGILLLLLTIIRIYSPKKWQTKIVTGLIFLIYTSLVIFFFGLIGRWYISGHAPWSDAYESMVYVGFTTLLVGTLLSKRSSLSLASSVLASSMVLTVAHWNFIDPAISNLAPVLDSYWLMIHVSIIVGSYGPFTLSMIIGFLTLFAFALSTSKNTSKVRLIIQELTIINELTLTLGLVLLTVGNFMGAIWANESWGRYWGWDPKETWALISILMYAFIIHFRFIPVLKGKFVFAIASIIAYLSILMTYFGVNFYLSGLHSYANGTKSLNLSYLGSFLLILTCLVYIASVKNKRFKII